MTDDGVVNLAAARKRLDAMKQAPTPIQRVGDPVAALADSMGELVAVTQGLAANLAATEAATAANAANIAKLTQAVESLTRTVAAALADIASRLPPAQDGQQ
jgi:hypothetical protein